MKFHINIPRLLSIVCVQATLFFSLHIICLQATPFGIETDRSALLYFKQGIIRDPNGVLNSWNETVPVCNWFGITCSSRHRRVTSMMINRQNLVGSISPSITNLSFLRVLDLRNNNLHGEIPQGVGRLFRLQQFLLSSNSIKGGIPHSIVNCSQLRRIGLGANYIVGTIPKDIGSLQKLEILSVPQNNLIGNIPPSVGNLSTLWWFSVASNNMDGSIPEEMGKLSNLYIFYIGINAFVGVIPQSMFNITSLKGFSTAQNQLYGTLPDSMCDTLPNLQIFVIGMNIFSGKIPKTISNCSQLDMFDISKNQFVGQVPNDIGNLRNLTWFNVGTNNVGCNSTEELVFLTSLTNCSNLQNLDIEFTNFGGIIPKSIANLSTQLNYIFFGGNQFVGNIPSALDNLPNLIVLALQNNLFTGSIPSYFGNFPHLQGLDVTRNKLSGYIPTTLGNLSQLSILLISQNKLEGRLPSSIANCQLLNQLEVSDNNLSGEIPPEILQMPSLSQILNLSNNLLSGSLSIEVGKLTHLAWLDLSANHFSGQIPPVIGDCTYLIYLSLQGNSFGGIIPSLTSLKDLHYLDLSHNNLTGKIPKDLSSLSSLFYLNLSYNDLEGEVPIGGVFQNASALSLIGNAKLCGGVTELHLPRCSIKPSKRGNFFGLKHAIIIIIVILFSILLVASLFLYRKRKSKVNIATESLRSNHAVKVSYTDLYHATNRFSSNNVIGAGSYGIVYKGFLGQMQLPIAVKVLNLEQKSASKSFLAECKTLRNVRHRNLVKLLTYCSSIDYKQNEFKALVYEFMPKGSLDRWLHADVESENQSNNLNFLQRLNIAIDVASALEHLHNFSESSIIHCDLKPSNILLDDGMVAHLSDFGLARFFSTTISPSESQTSTTGIKGTIGYAAPEYGTAYAPSKEGDAYSFGILVLEMFTGRRPVDEMFKEGLNLHDFVKTALPERIFYITDPLLIPRQAVATVETKVDDADEIVAEEEINNENHREMTEKMMKCLLSMFEIGIACSLQSPKGRINMMDVTGKLHSIKTDFLGTHHNADRQRIRLQQA